MRPFQNILVVAGGLSAGNAVLERGLELARKSGARLAVIDVGTSGAPPRDERRPVVSRRPERPG